MVCISDEGQKESVMKIMDNLVSVIIPVYNVEAYVDDCIKSVVSQSYKNLEIILIDDGSTDLSGEKCDEWGKRDSRIRVIHQKNGGLSAARNAGIDRCNGKWIVFVDSDDVVGLNYVMHLYELTQKYNVLAAQCSNENIRKNADQTKKFECQLVKSSDFLLSSQFQPMAWGKIYNRELFKRERYPVNMIHEDMATTYKLIYAAGNIAFSNEILYFVRQREGSITRKKKFYKERLIVLQFYKEQIEFYEKKNEERLVKKGYREYAYALLNDYYNTKIELKERNIAIKIKKEYRRICIRVVRKDEIISVKTRILLVICFVFPELWRLFLKN